MAKPKKSPNAKAKEAKAEESPSPTTSSSPLAEKESTPPQHTDEQYSDVGEEAETKTEPAQPDTPPDFESWYLRQATSEFADDVEKLRKAKDFNEHSLPILIDALKSGTTLFSEEQQGRIMEAVRQDSEREKTGSGMHGEGD